ncbi:uncharacterized protein AB9W97_014953 [Spinachia spinachia]
MGSSAGSDHESLMSHASCSSQPIGIRIMLCQRSCSLLLALSLVSHPVANCHRSSDSDSSDEARREPDHHSSESRSHERGNRHPPPKWPFFPLWPFPGVWPPPAPPAPPPPAPTPAPATTEPRGDSG